MRAAMPLYEKSHSWGEFVFDWAWAQAYERAGLNYYPKLVSAIPFTPAQSSRLLLKDKTRKLRMLCCQGQFNWQKKLSVRLCISSFRHSWTCRYVKI